MKITFMKDAKKFLTIEQYRAGQALIKALKNEQEEYGMTIEEMVLTAALRLWVHNKKDGKTGFEVLKVESEICRSNAIPLNYFSDNINGISVPSDDVDVFISATLKVGFNYYLEVRFELSAFLRGYGYGTDPDDYETLYRRAGFDVFELVRK